MNTSTELRAAYRELADQAPGYLSLDLPHHRQAAARSGFAFVPRVVLTAAVVVLLAVAPFILLSHRHQGRPVSAAAPVGFATSYTYGVSSLPGYTMTSSFLSPDGQNFSYQQDRPPAGRTGQSLQIAIASLSNAEEIAFTRGTPVTVGSHVAYFGRLHSYDPDQSLAWKNPGGQWTALSGRASVSSVDTGARAPGLTEPVLVNLGRALAQHTDPLAALVKVGYLPSAQVFSAAASYLDQGEILAPDGTLGSGYRTLSFTDRTRASNDAASLDIDTVFSPRLRLTDAPTVIAALPSPGPWQQTTIRGHLAFTSPHAVLIQWGTVQIGVATSRVAGSTAPLVPLAELLKVANSLTVPADLAPGHGYPLTAAVPEHHLS